MGGGGGGVLFTHSLFVNHFNVATSSFSSLADYHVKAVPHSKTMFNAWNTYTPRWAAPEPVGVWCSGRCKEPFGSGTLPSCPASHWSASNVHRVFPPPNLPTAWAGPCLPETTEQVGGAYHRPNTWALRSRPHWHWPHPLRLAHSEQEERLEKEESIVVRGDVLFKEVWPFKKMIKKK